MREFEQAVRLIQSICPEVSCHDLSRSFTGLEPRAGISTWAQRWVRKATRFPRPEPPLSDGNQFRCLGTAADIHEAAKRFQNCLVTKLPEVVLGRVFYAEYLPTPVLIELARLSRGAWSLEGLYGPSNAQLADETVGESLSALSRAGILIPARFSEPEANRSIAPLLGIWSSIVSGTMFG
jgi:hypothetical protein